MPAEPRREIPEFLVAGGGIGGLAAALALAGRGQRVHVVERRQNATEEGAGIQIGPNGTRILRQLGVADALKPLVSVPEAISVRSGEQGREITRLPLGSWIEARHGAPYWVLHRQDLHAALKEAVTREPRIRLSEGISVVSASTAGHAVIATLSTGEECSVAALIAADGLWSHFRRTNFEGGPLQPSGKCAFRAVISAADVEDGISLADTTIWLQPAAHVVHYPVRAGRELAIVVIIDDPEITAGWAKDTPAATVRRHAKDFPAALARLIGKAATWRQWTLYECPATHRWATGRIALLGDAAHPVLPFLAQGAVMALEDAVVLADALSRSTGADVPGALVRYEGMRKARCCSVARASRQNGAIYHLDGPAGLARDTTLRLLPPALVMSRYDWLYGWKG